MILFFILCLFCYLTHKLFSYAHLVYLAIFLYVIWCVLEQEKSRVLLDICNGMPLTSVVSGSLLVYLSHAEKRGVQVVSIRPFDLLSLLLHLGFSDFSPLR